MIVPVNVVHPNGLTIEKMRGPRVAQWWEHSPPTNAARVRILASTPYVGWVCCWFSPLLREVFLRVFRCCPLLKNQHFQTPIRSGTHGHVSASSYELLSDPWVNNYDDLSLDFELARYCKNLWRAKKSMVRALWMGTRFQFHFVHE